MINFNFLTPFQLATFVLGIVFSILTIGIVFYTLRHPRGYSNNVVKVIFTFVIPMVAITMWFMCIFAAYEIFEKELYSILLAMGCGAVVAGLTYWVAWTINKNYGKTSNEEEVEELAEINAELDAEEAQAQEAAKVEIIKTEDVKAENIEVEAEVENVDETNEENNEND